MSELQQYKSHKIVHARPMTRKEYETYFSRQSPLVEMAAPHRDLADCEGYHVVYQKDSTQHYEAWSPKEPFEEGYTGCSTGDWATRLEAEQEALDELVVKLETFLQSEECEKLDIVAHRLLILQREAMKQYWNAMDDRIQYNQALLAEALDASASTGRKYPRAELLQIITDNHEELEAIKTELSMAADDIAAVDIGESEITALGDDMQMERVDIPED